MRERLSRRKFLKIVGVAAAGSMLEACSPSNPELTPPEPGPQPSPRPSPEKSNFLNIADWEARGEIPQNNMEWEKTVALFDKEITSVLGSPKFAAPLAEICKFWSVLGQSEQNQWAETVIIPSESADCKKVFTICLIESQVLIDIEKKQVTLVSPDVAGLLLRIPEKSELGEMGELGNFFSRLDQKSIFELGLILNLINLRSGFGKETLWLPASESPDQTVALRESLGFQAVKIDLKNQENLQPRLLFNHLDTWARLYSFWPQLEKTAPVLWNHLCKTCSPFFFQLMKKLDISSSEVWYYCQKGSLIKFLGTIGGKIYEKGIRPEDRTYKTDNITLLGLAALACADTPNNTCNDLLEVLEILDKQGEEYLRL